MPRVSIAEIEDALSQKSVTFPENARAGFLSLHQEPLFGATHER